jgi:hypothetical protein
MVMCWYVGVEVWCWRKGGMRMRMMGCTRVVGLGRDLD